MHTFWLGSVISTATLPLMMLSHPCTVLHDTCPLQYCTLQPGVGGNEKVKLAKALSYPVVVHIKVWGHKLNPHRVAVVWKHIFLIQGHMHFKFRYWQNSRPPSQPWISPKSPPKRTFNGHETRFCWQNLVSETLSVLPRVPPYSTTNCQLHLSWCWHACCARPTPSQ